MGRKLVQEAIGGGNKAHWIALLVLSVFKKPPSVLSSCVR